MVVVDGGCTCDCTWLSCEATAHVPIPPRATSAAPPPRSTWRRVIPFCAGGTVNLLPSPGGKESCKRPSCPGEEINAAPLVGGSGACMSVPANGALMQARCNSVTKVCADGGRCSGTFSNPRSSTCSTAIGRVGLICRGGGGGARMCCM